MIPTRALVIFASLLTVRTHNVSDQCLLQKASSLRKSSATGVLAPDTHRSWREEHKLALADMGESMDVLQQFINAQQASGDACSSRLLESKRVLDGLLKDLKSISSQVDSHEEVLETETSNLNITELSVKAVEVTHKEAMLVCEKEKQDAADRVSQYQSELAELDQIAKPSVRLEHVTKVEISNVTKSSLTGKSSLLQEGLWSKESCLAFVDFQKRKHKTKLRQKSTKKQEPGATISVPQKEPDAVEDNNDNNNDNNNNNAASESPIPDKVDCDSQREELQKAFTEAYITTRNLLKESQSDVEDTTCVDTAEAKKAADLVPLVSERERAASLIESSSQAIAALEPVLDLLHSRVEKLSDHIYNTLTPECAEAKEVSEALQKIRDLIIVLEECPGRNDFKLKIPEETEEYQKSTGGCVPFSRTRCEEVAKQLNLKLGGGGASFAGSYRVKGCYAYRSGTYGGSAYYGTGGTQAQMEAPVTGTKFRPPGYDTCTGVDEVIEAAGEAAA